jgi:hypothetical protein
VRKKVKKYFLVQNEKGTRFYGAFPLGESGRLQAEAHARALRKKHGEVFNVVEA